MLSDSKLFDSATLHFIQTQFSKVAFQTLENLQSISLQKKGKQWQELFFINPCLTELAMESALIDLERMAKFHLPDSLPDRHKYAGYFAYWIAKIKPIQITANLKGLYSGMAINAMYAAEMMFSLILPDGEIPQKTGETLKYSLQYREVPAHALALVAFALEREAPAGFVLPSLP